MTPGSRKRVLPHVAPGRVRAFVLQVPALFALLVVGLAVLGAGLSRFAGQGIYERGPATLHIDDVDAQTLQAYPWIQITHAHLCQRPRDVRVVDGDRYAYASLISAQQVRDCRLGVLSNCCLSPVMLRIPDDERRLRGGISGAMNVTGMLTTPHASELDVLLPGQMLLLVGEEPEAQRGAYGLMLGGVVLVLFAACGLVWRLRVRRC